MSKSRDGVYLAFALVGVAVMLFGLWRARQGGADSPWLRHEVVGDTRIYH